MGNMKCTVEELLHAYDIWLLESHGVPGSSFAVYVLGTDKAPAYLGYMWIVPPRSLGERIAVSLGARSKLHNILPKKSSSGSGIMEGLHLISVDASERRGTHTIKTISDFIQETPGKWNFGRTIPKTKEFLDYFEKNKQMAHLPGVTVIMCVTRSWQDPTAKEFSPGLLESSKALWTEVFQAMGVKDLQIFSREQCAMLGAQHGK
jgi:hypothetical protein